MLHVCINGTAQIRVDNILAMPPTTQIYAKHGDIWMYLSSVLVLEAVLGHQNSS